MVSQLPRVSSVESSFDYIKKVYEPSLNQYLNNNNYSNWQEAQKSIKKGRKILSSHEEVDTYIAFYGAHHYYKLVEAFGTLDISGFNNLEVISYGCGAATATCSLISYCRERQLNLPFKNIILIDPSQISLDRGVKYIQQALSPEELDRIGIKRKYKLINQLKNDDLNSDSQATKLHLFSNILDVNEINLQVLASLIRETQSGTNYFVCVNPMNSESKSRIDEFYNNFSDLYQLSEINTNDEEISGKKIWMMKYNKYIYNCSIARYHRIFQINFF